MLPMALFMLNCFSSEKSLPETTGTGQISGKVVGPDGTALPGVQVTTTVKGKTIQTTTTNTGLFAINVSDIERGQGFNLQFTKTNFENANQAAVISLPNLKVDIGSVTMFISGGSEVTNRKILGQVLDNFSYRPLAGANVTTIDSAGLAVVTTTDDSGKFALSSNYFALQSTFAVSVFKSNYITRTDLVAKITAEDNTIRNNPIRLYHKFGSIYAYVTDYSKIPAVTALNGVTVSLTNSNNQVLQCVTGTGVAPSGPYDVVPLAVGAYCPNLAGITSPISGTIGDNNGGVKFQNDFLFLGSRYTVNMTFAAAGCATRSPGAFPCFKPVTSYVDLFFTGDNPMSGVSKPMYFDIFIMGTVEDSVTSATKIAGATVKVYDSVNTLITQTTTDAAGKFLIDSPQLLSTGTYKLTIEKNGYQTRTLSGAGDSAPVAVPDPLSVNTPPATYVGPLAAGSYTGMIAGYNEAVNPAPVHGGNIKMKLLPPPAQTITGILKDYWTGLPIVGATVEVTDNNGLRSIATDASGIFNLAGNFTCGNNYVMHAKKNGYTGDLLVSEQNFKLTLPMDAFLAASGGGCTRIAGPAPYDITAAGVNQCGLNDGLPAAASSFCTPYVQLWPIGIYANINGSFKYFKYQIKQTYEKFLTEKNGLTISGRTGDLQLTSATPQKTYDYDGIYLHLDDTPKILPGVPEGKWSNHVPVNPLPTVCSPTVSSPCSPQANGVLSENIGTDTRILAWDIKTYVYYHFYAAAPGQYTIQTTGSTDTHITLIAQTGANLGSDDDSGSGSNARIGPINLLRGWYYIKVRGKNDNVFGFFDVSVTGPTAAQSNYNTILSPAATYETNCASNNGNLVLSWYDATGHVLYIAGPGENGGCNASATLEKHGPIGDIVRGRFGGLLRPVAPVGSTATVTSTGQFQGFYNIIRSE